MKKFVFAVLLVAAMVLGTISACAVSEIPGLVWESCVEKEFATEFNIDYYEGGYALIEVVDDCKYLVVPENMPVPEGMDAGINVLRQPLDKIYLQATSAMALFDRLNGLDSIRLVGTRQNGWYVDNAVKAMEDGSILFSGSYSEPDYELMINEGCDLAIESTMILHSPKVKEMIEMLGIPVFVEHASYEEHPLGRTEWIKVYGAMLGKREEADAFFDTQSDIIEEFVGIENTGKKVAFFYVASDNSINVRSSTDYVPKMIEIAGGRYVFDKLSETGGKRSSVSLTMEEFYNAAIDADYLVYNATIDDPIYSIDELIAKDALFADFKAVQSGEVWCTGKALFQATDITGSMIVDFYNMLSGEGEMTFLYKLP